MPKKEIDYQNTIIYKIVCNDLNVKDVYVGHTTNFTKRKTRHKYDCINHNSKKRNLKVYETIRDNGGWENWSMIEIEKYNCNDCNEACSRERYWYELLNANLNMICPTLNVEKRMENQTTARLLNGQCQYVCQQVSQDELLLSIRVAVFVHAEH